MFILSSVSRVPHLQHHKLIKNIQPLLLRRGLKKRKTHASLKGTRCEPLPLNLTTCPWKWTSFTPVPKPNPLFLVRGQFLTWLLMWHHSKAYEWNSEYFYSFSFFFLHFTKSCHIQSHPPPAAGGKSEGGVKLLEYLPQTVTPLCPAGSNMEWGSAGEKCSPRDLLPLLLRLIGTLFSIVRMSGLQIGFSGQPIVYVCV